VRIVVGSKALQFFGITRREPKDTDLWVDDESILEEGTDGHVLPTEIMSMIPTVQGYAIPNAIYTIKCSHFGWDIHWEKTKYDILFLKSKYRPRLIPELYEALVEHWNKEHGDKSYLSLSQDKEDFFNDYVKYKYDHDYLHELVAYPNKPVYTKCLKDGNSVLTDKAKFGKMSFEAQVKMFREEIVVIACERWLVHKPDIGWYKAYMLSLKKTITRLTKNWACDFIIQNLEYFVKPEFNMFEHILNNLEETSMSKVDLAVFEELLEKGGEEGSSLEAVVWSLCEGDFGENIVSWEGTYEDYKQKCNVLAEEFGYEHLDQEGGGEGGSEYCYGVFKLKGKVYRAEYSYYSYEGSDYSDILGTLKEVKPVQKTITVYE
jgi:hypothetical protein